MFLIQDIVIIRRSIIFVTIIMLVYKSTVAGIIDPSCRAESPDCVCSMENAQEELNRKFLSLQRAELEESLKRYQCVENFERLPRSLIIDASQTQYINPNTGIFIHDDGFYHKRKFRYLRRRKKRQVLIGVPTDEVFNEAIAQLNPDALHQYVVLGSIAHFTCVGPNIDVLDEIDPHARRFTWSHYDGAPITAPQSVVNQIHGTFTLSSVQLSDTGIYNCSIEYTNTNGQPEAIIFSHQLSVVSEPLFTLQFSLRYTTDSCERLEKILISDHLTTWIQQYICPYCQVHNPVVHCEHGGAYEDPSSAREYEIALVISLANANFRFDRGSTYYEHLHSCTVSCSELYQVKLLEVVRDSLVKLFSLPIEITMGYQNPSIVHYSIPQTLDMELLLGCLSGFHLNFKLCFPCDVGQFSPEGSSECFPCEIGTYQSLPGSSSCIPCENNYKTLGPGSTSHSACVVNTVADLTTFIIRHKFLFLALFLTLLLIIIILLIIRCCCPTNSRLGRCVNASCCCCCPARDQYDYEQSPLSNEINMVEFRKSSKHETRRKSPAVAGLGGVGNNNKIKYKRIPDQESEEPGDHVHIHDHRHKEKKDRRGDKVRRTGGVASNARTKSFTNVGSILLKKTAYEEEDEEDENAAAAENENADDVHSVTTTTSSKHAMRKILLSDGEDEDEEPIKSSVALANKSSRKYFPEINPRNVNNSIKHKVGFSKQGRQHAHVHDPLALHRCVSPHCTPPKEPKSLPPPPVTPHLRHVEGLKNTQGYIPKPPPLPNFSYSKV